MTTATATAIGPATMTGPLYKLTDAIREALAAIDDIADDTGEIPPDLEQVLDALQMAIEHKVEGICKFRANLIATAAGVKAEMDRLAAFYHALDSRADWLKGYILRHMMATGTQKIEAGTFRVRIQKNSRPSIALAAGAAIPEAFLRVVREFDGAAAYAAWKAGEKLPECVRVVEGCHLRIT